MAPSSTSPETFTNHLHGAVVKNGAANSGSSSSNNNKARGGGGSARRLLGAAGAASTSAAATSGGSPNPQNPPFMIMPDSQFHLTWIQVRVVVALYIVWVTPVRVGFSLPAEGAWFWIEAAIDLFFAADVALNFFTAYEDPSTGELVRCRRAVARRYLRGWFAVDLLASLPVEFAVRAAERSWLCSVRADCLWGLATESALASAASGLRGLRVFRVAWIVKRLRHMRASHLLGALADDLYLAVAPFLSIAELLVVLLYLGHACGCFFYMLSTPRWQTPHEKALVAGGQMETWTSRTFGGERLVMPPLQCGAGGQQQLLLLGNGSAVGPRGAPLTVLNGSAPASSFVLSAAGAGPSPPLPPPLRCLEVAGLLPPGSGNASLSSAPPVLTAHALPPGNNSTTTTTTLPPPPPPSPPSAPFPLIALDPSSGLWHACPRQGYSIVPCPPCTTTASTSPSPSFFLQQATTAATTTPRCCYDLPPFRCRTLYRLPYRYVTSVYWAYTTMTTVGYGDIAAVTAAEKIWAITTMIIAGFFFSFVVGRVASAVSKLDAHRAAAEERLEAARSLAHDASLPRALSKRVLDHLKKQQVRPYDRDRVLRSLPFALRAPVLRHLYGRAVENVPLLARLAREAGGGGVGGTGQGGGRGAAAGGGGGRGGGGGGGGASGGAEADSDAELFLADVCSRLQPYNVAARSHVYQRGEAGGDLFVLLRGELHVVAERVVVVRAPRATTTAVAATGGGEDGDAGRAAPKPPSSSTSATICLRLRIPEGSIFGEGAALKAFEAAGGGALAAAAATATATANAATAPAPLPMTARPRREEAVYATTPASLLRIRQEDAVDLLALHPRLAEALARLQRARAAEVDALARDEEEARAEAAAAEAEAAVAAVGGPGASAETQAAATSGGTQLLRDLLRRMAPPRGLLPSGGAADQQPPRSGGAAASLAATAPTWGGASTTTMGATATTGGWGNNTYNHRSHHHHNHHHMEDWRTIYGGGGAGGAGAGGAGCTLGAEREPLLLVDAADSAAASSLSFSGGGGRSGGGQSSVGGGLWGGGPTATAAAAATTATAPASLPPRRSTAADDGGGAFGSTCAPVLMLNTDTMVRRRSHQMEGEKEQEGPPPSGAPDAAAAASAVAAAAAAAVAAATAAAGEAMAAVRAMTEEMAHLRAALEAGPVAGGGIL